MNPQEKLIKLMEAKQERLGLCYDYFNEKDAEFLLSLGDEEALRCWNVFVRTIKKGGDGLGMKLCPFCIYCFSHDISCSECQYANNHGSTCEDSYTIQKIYTDRAVNTLTNQFYLEVIDEIEGKG